MDVESKHTDRFDFDGFWKDLIGLMQAPGTVNGKKAVFGASKAGNKSEGVKYHRFEAPGKPPLMAK